MNYLVYIIAVGSAIILGLVFKQPLLPEEPKRQSWTISAIFPTGVLALGFTAMVSKLGYLNYSNTYYIIALAIGVLTAVFSKFILETILPRPKVPDETPMIDEPSERPPKESDESTESEKTSKENKTSGSQEESHG